MTRIFISYRREDSAGYAGRIADVLDVRYGAGNVFRDVDDIRPGEDFVRRLEAALEHCDVVLPIIGRSWASIADSSGRPRLDDPDDYVRRELLTALERDMTVIPLLVDGARMPQPAELPTPLAALSRRQGLVMADRSWESDVKALTAAIDAGRPPPEERPPARNAAWAGRWRRSIGAAAVALAGAAFAGWLALRPPDLSGQWTMSDGSIWMVQQSGRALTIEEIHYESGEVWRRGKAQLSGKALDVEMHYVFHPDVHLSGPLRLGADGRSIVGSLTQAPGGRQVAFSMQR